jgi:hypothetical protein
VTLRDTAPEIRRRQIEVYRGMRPDERVALAVALSEDVRRIALEGIRDRNPEFDEARVHREWLRILHGDELVPRLVPHNPSR